MEHVNCWCFRGIYKGGLWEDDLLASALNSETVYTNWKVVAIRTTVAPIRILIRTTVVPIRILIRTTAIISALS